MVVVKYSSERCIHREFVDYGIKFQIIRKFRAFLYIRESLLGMLRLLAWNIVLNNLGNFCWYKSNWHYVYYIIILNIYIKYKFLAVSLKNLWYLKIFPEEKFFLQVFWSKRNNGTSPPLPPKRDYIVIFPEYYLRMCRWNYLGFWFQNFKNRYMLLNFLQKKK